MLLAASEPSSAAQNEGHCRAFMGLLCRERRAAPEMLSWLVIQLFFTSFLLATKHFKTCMYSILVANQTEQVPAVSGHLK